MLLRVLHGLEALLGDLAIHWVCCRGRHPVAACDVRKATSLYFLSSIFFCWAGSAKGEREDRPALRLGGRALETTAVTSGRAFLGPGTDFGWHFNPARSERLTANRRQQTPCSAVWLRHSATHTDSRRLRRQKLAGPERRKYKHQTRGTHTEYAVRSAVCCLAVLFYPGRLHRPATPKTKTPISTIAPTAPAT